MSFLIYQTAQAGSHHAAGKCQKASGSHEIADQGSTKGHGCPIDRSQENPRHHIDQMLDGKAFGCPDRNGKGRQAHPKGHHHTCCRKLSYLKLHIVFLTHFCFLLFSCREISCRSICFLFFSLS